MSLVFLGSGPFAVPALEALARGSTRPSLVVTRPDRPGGRGLRPIPTPVRERAAALGLAVEAPHSANDAAFLERLRALGPEVILVADYGEMLREPLRSIPRIGIFNLHGSLLPRHRGAAPVPAAILAGDPETGVTLFRIAKGLDSGPVVARIATPIGPLETAGELEERLARLAADLLDSTLPELLSGKFAEETQRDDLATLAPKLAKGAGAIDWSLAPGPLANFIRAMSPRPGAFTFLRRAAADPSRPPDRIRILRARPAPAGPADPSRAPSAPGTITLVEKHRFLVAAGGGEIEPLEIQPAGKGAMPVPDYLRGSRIKPGDRFEQEL
jgi:methionyl-tRNA formyltransferase